MSEEVLRYIFNNFEKIEKAVKVQNRTNRNFAIAIIGLSVVAVTQAKKISELEYTVGKLKRDLANQEAE